MKTQLLSLLLFPAAIFAQTPTIYFSTSAINLEEGNQTEQINLSINPAPTNNENVQLSIQLDGNVEASDLITSPAHDQGVFNLEVPAGSTTVSFFISAPGSDSMEGTEFSSISISMVSSGLIVGQPSIINIAISEPAVNQLPLFINEIQSNNTNTIADSSGEYDDWIELYNAGDTEIDLTGFYLSNDRMNAYKAEIPYSLMDNIIPAGGFKIIWADSTPDQGSMHVGFRLQDENGWVGLFTAQVAADLQLLLVDSVNYTNLASNFSSGRQTDGAGPWTSFSTPTPGSSNVSASFGVLKSNTWKVYPNPAKMGSQLHIREALPVSMQIALIGLDGRLQTTGAIAQGESSFQINSDLKPGMYLLRMEYQGKTMYDKILLIP